MKRFPSMLLVVATLLVSASAFAQHDDTMAIGIRGNIVTAGGVPANDILSLGVYGRYRLSNGWLVGLSVDRAEYDFEVPWRVVGLEQDPGLPAIDAPASSTIFSAAVEREYGRDISPYRWFWNAGAGFASPTVGRTVGPVRGGGTFDLETDPGTEIIASAAVGVRRTLGPHLALEFALRADHHFSEWKVTDHVSGRTGKTDDYTGLGAHLGINYRF